MLIAVSVSIRAGTSISGRATGEDRGGADEVNINRATFVPIVPPENPVHRTKPVSANKIKGQTKRGRESTTQESGTDAQGSSPQMSLEMSPQNISEGAVREMRMIEDDQNKGSDNF